MSMNVTAASMIKIIKAVIEGKSIDIAAMGIDWEEMQSLCAFHSVSNLIAYAMDGSVPKDIADKFAQHSSVAFARYAGYDYATKEICRIFEEKHISYMPLKGYIMKDYYPSPEMRTMCDVDILVKADELDKVDEVMTGLGYTNLKLERDDEVTYQRLPLLSYEMHTQLVSSRHTKIDAYYGDGWKFARKDTDYGYKMSDEDFFVFLIAHFAKHYQTGGIGVRPVIDVWIYLKSFKDKLDWEYIDKELDKLELREFAYNLFKLSDVWFNGAEAEKKILDMAEYVLMSGLYGTVENVGKTKRMKQKNQTIYTIKLYFNAVFLDYDSMAKMFPQIKKFPPLIVYYWLKRLATKLIDGSVNRFTNLQKQTDSASAEKTRKHFEDIGL